MTINWQQLVLVLLANGTSAWGITRGMQRTWRAGCLVLVFVFGLSSGLAPVWVATLGVLSTSICAWVCLHQPWRQMLPSIVLSALTTALQVIYPSALPAAALALIVSALPLLRSQRDWWFRGAVCVLAAGIFALTAVTHGWFTPACLALGLLALGLAQHLTQTFLANQDAVFAVGLDKMMAQYSQEVQELYAGMRGWRHDYHDHLQALKAYLRAGDTAAAQDYLNQLEDKLDSVDPLVHSGNPLLDAIVNAKLTLAERAQIPTNVKVLVGTTPLIDDVDLVVIVGNLLDNAIEAITEQPADETRRLRVYISILKQQLYISVTNTRPLDQVIDVNYASTKNDKRGLGIRRINRLVAKYGGVINRQYADEVFVTEIALPIGGRK
ncbi:sensor histidine kinase [Lacticaseibacillus sharpeae]|uniref:Two component sensor transduction histidine kinase n=1 Tax=Lacticaseibacillus sharpeae JCM 1186 = DSM 20505 TaxID=1291052 RepID=A0A0R1ZTY6_9LACO|nr:two component sensor transduction histidine kinase [Lacticaseibacillus sharpeae JCM 1186 = DSM 20505]